MGKGDCPGRLQRKQGLFLSDRRVTVLFLKKRKRPRRLLLREKGLRKKEDPGECRVLRKKAAIKEGGGDLGNRKDANSGGEGEHLFGREEPLVLWRGEVN